MTIAQSGLESGWGQRVIGNAYFGIKGRSPAGQSTEFRSLGSDQRRTNRDSGTFRAYLNYADAANDYGNFLNDNQRYRTAFQFANDPVRFAEAIAAAGYATDPSYGKLRTKIIHSYGLAEYDTPKT